MRSQYTQLLALQRHNLSFGSRAFRISAPNNWNTLPLVVRQSHSLSTFRNRLAAVVYLHDITTYINIREISQMNHANKDLKEVKNL